MTVWRVATVENPTNPRDSWAIFNDGRRVYGPANLYACLRERDRLVSTLIHGELRAA